MIRFNIGNMPFFGCLGRRSRGGVTERGEKLLLMISVKTTQGKFRKVRLCVFGVYWFKRFASVNRGIIREGLIIYCETLRAQL